MAILDKTKREPNYFNDINVFGKRGEIDFENTIVPKLLKKGYKIFDVRNIIYFQHCDIDYVVDKIGRDILNENYDEVISSKEYVKVEVKCSTVALKTNHIAYEVVSHASLGWSILTKSDYIYIVFCGEDLEIKKRAWIDMDLWHKFVTDRKKHKKVNVIKNESIVDLLCRIDDLKSDNILTFL